jgi:hypothetical protein
MLPGADRKLYVPVARGYCPGQITTIDIHLAMLWGDDDEERLLGGDVVHIAL